jgi:hypothetical protein
MLRGLSDEVLEPLAERLQMHRYEDKTRLLDHPSIEADSRPSTLRILAHGHASWEPFGTEEKTGAWMLMPGSVLGLDAIDHWARSKKLPGAWAFDEVPSVRARTMGPVWMLELPWEHFDDALGPTGGPLADRLLSMVPTILYAPAIVAALRELPQFSRVRSVSLFRMLEHARTVTFYPQQELGQVEAEAEGQAESPMPQHRLVPKDRALYYVLDGVLEIETDDETLFIGPGSLGGPDVFRHSTRELGTPTSSTETHAVVIDGRALYEMVLSNPGFGRSLGPHVIQLEVGE